MPLVTLGKNRHEQEHHVLAFVTPCKTKGSDATVCLTAYADSPTGKDAPRFINLNSIECAVGRIKSRNGWFIIDRSAGLARTSFVDDDNSDEEN